MLPCGRQRFFIIADNLLGAVVRFGRRDQIRLALRPTGGLRGGDARQGYALQQQIEQNEGDCEPNNLPREILRLELRQLASPPCAGSSAHAGAVKPSDTTERSERRIILTSTRLANEHERDDETEQEYEFGRGEADVTDGRRTCQQRPGCAQSR